MSLVDAACAPAPARPRAVAGRLARIAILVLALGALLASSLVAASSSTPAAAAGWYTSAPAQAKAYPTLKFGSRGVAVAYVQKRLLLTPTGFYNRTTERVVKGWERRNGMAPDGRITKGNWIALRVPYSRASSSGSAVSGSEAAKRAAILRWARAQFGKPYVSGGDGPSVFDCSGYVQYVVKKAIGRSLPRIATDQMRATRRISRSSAKAGDLVFIRAGSRTSHAAIYAGGSYWYDAANPSRPVGRTKIYTSDLIFTSLF